MISRVETDLRNWGKPYPMGAIAFDDDTGEVYSEYCDSIDEFCSFFKACRNQYSDNPELSISIDAEELEECVDFIKELRHGWRAVTEENERSKRVISEMLNDAITGIFMHCQKGKPGDISPLDAFRLDELQGEMTELISRTIG